MSCRDLTIFNIGLEAVETENKADLTVSFITPSGSRIIIIIIIMGFIEHYLRIVQKC